MTGLGLRKLSRRCRCSNPKPPEMGGFLWSLRQKVFCIAKTTLADAVFRSAPAVRSPRTPRANADDGGERLPV